MKKVSLFVISLVAVIFLSGIGCSTEIPKASVPPSITALANAEEAGKASGIIWSQQNVGLWVNADGKVTGVPDIAILSLGVQVQEKSVAEAQASAADAMDKIMKVLKAKGVADKDIQTSQFNIQLLTRWNDKENKQEIIGYQIINTVNAKIRKVNEAGGVIDAVAAAGGDATRINNISFTVDDPTPYQKEARDKAVANAMAKAKQIATAAGIRLGKPVYITESTPYIPSPTRDFNMKAAAAPDSVPTPISTGELEFQVSVQIVYTID